MNYQRAKRSFWIGYEVDDEVVSEKLGKYGDFEKPEDYLEAFAKFVKDNADQIAAIKILLEKPRQWNPDALEELRQKLKENNYKEKDLSEAHKIVYHKSLADIISMVKHAARDTEPIFSAVERVDRAIEKISKGQSFNEEQLKWISLIREHLVQNLTIEEDDFDVMPIFEQFGGRGKARKVFGDKLPALIEELNLSIAA